MQNRGNESDELFEVVLGSVLVAVVAALAGAYLTSTVIPTDFGSVRSAPLHEIELTSGSLLLFECNLEINLVLCTHWSHIGLIVETEEGVPMCVDLTPTSQTVQMQPAHEVIERELQNGTHRVAIRQLVGGPDPTKALRRFFAHRREAYQHSYWKPAIRRITRLLDVSPVRTDSYFCSNVIADALQQAGVLAIDAEEAHNLLPPDFAQELVTAPDYRYEPMLLIKVVRQSPGSALPPERAAEDVGANDGDDRVEDAEGEQNREEQVSVARGRADHGEVPDGGDARRERPADVQAERHRHVRGEAARDGDDAGNQPAAEAGLKKQDDAHPRVDRAADEEKALVPRETAVDLPAGVLPRRRKKRTRSVPPRVGGVPRVGGRREREGVGEADGADEGIVPPGIGDDRGR